MEILTIFYTLDSSTLHLQAPSQANTLPWLNPTFLVVPMQWQQVLYSLIAGINVRGTHVREYLRRVSNAADVGREHVFVSTACLKGSWGFWGRKWNVMGLKRPALSNAPIFQWVAMACRESWAMAAHQDPAVLMQSGRASVRNTMPNSVTFMVPPEP